MTSYALHNISRSRMNRTDRAALGKKPRLAAYVTINGQPRRLIRGRPTIIGAEVLEKNIDLLRSLEKEQVLEVRTLDGRRVDLSTMTASARASTSPPPNFLPDSLARDDAWGERMPPQLGDLVDEDGNEVPADHVPELIKRADVDVDPVQDAPAVEPPPPPPVELPPAAVVAPEEQKEAMVSPEDAALEAALLAAQQEGDEEEGDEEEEAVETAATTPTGTVPNQQVHRGKRHRRGR